MDWKYSFTDLPQYDTDGNEYEYTVKEEAVPGYSFSVDGSNVTNTLLTEISGEKIWKGDDKEPSARPESITVKLLQNGAEYDQKTVSEYKYTVKEEVVPEGYVESVDGYNITNTYTGILEISGQKTWVDGNNADSKRPTEITVKLYQKVKNAEGEATEYDSLTVTAENDWKYSFTDLPQYDADGAEYEYTVKEEPVAGYSSELEGYDITNTLLTEISGVKTWKGDDKEPSARPESITVKLLQNGAEYDQKTVSEA